MIFFITILSSNNNNKQFAVIPILVEARTNIHNHFAAYRRMLR